MGPLARSEPARRSTSCSPRAPRTRCASRPTRSSPTTSRSHRGPGNLCSAWSTSLILVSLLLSVCSGSGGSSSPRSPSRWPDRRPSATVSMVCTADAEQEIAPRRSGLALRVRSRCGMRLAHVLSCSYDYADAARIVLTVKEALERRRDDGVLRRRSASPRTDTFLGDRRRLVPHHRRFARGAQATRCCSSTSRVFPGSFGKPPTEARALP